MTIHRTPETLRSDALAIWRAGVAAVASDRLVEQTVTVAGDLLRIADQVIALPEIRRLVVVGAGKAGAGMAAGLEAALGAAVMDQKNLTGWLNVPADCVLPTRRIALHAARAAGVNEPTAEGVHGSERILQMVSELAQDDLCICLLSGGGSALLPAPAPGISLADKLAITQHLSGAGANIEQLNTVRKQLSRIKGGGLARACRAGRLITLIISDVIGDPLDVIASGPTVANTTTAADALEILRAFHVREAGIAAAAVKLLESRAQDQPPYLSQPLSSVSNIVIGNNAVAVDAAGAEAERRGYSHAMVAARTLEGEAEGVGKHLAQMARHMLASPGPDCLISGGEPTVTLVDPARRGLGGRNQQLTLAALQTLLQSTQTEAHPPGHGIVILSGGTDGEDGPTDAAGALADQPLAEAALRRGLDPEDYLRRNDAYHFFQPLDGLIKTGPTHTNVCDLRVVLVNRTVPGWQ